MAVCQRSSPTPSARRRRSPIAVRVSLDVVDAAAVRAAEATISDYEARHLKVWLATPMPATVQDAEVWRSALRRWVAAHKQSLAILELRLSSQAVDTRGLYNPRRLD